MAERDTTEHISESTMERFCMRLLTESELTMAARHLTGCPDCQAKFVSTLRRQREVADLSFTLAPEFWLRHDHLDYEQLVELGEAVDRLEPAGAQVTEDPAIMAEGIEGQSHPAPGLLELWELAHVRRLCGPGNPDLMARSAFPQETLNLLGCGSGRWRDHEVVGRR